MNEKVIFENGKYQVIEREYYPECFVYDLRSIKTGEVYLAYTMSSEEAIAHADWYAKN